MTQFLVRVRANVYLCSVWAKHDEKSEIRMVNSGPEQKLVSIPFFMLHVFNNSPKTFRCSHIFHSMPRLCFNTKRETYKLKARRVLYTDQQ